MTFTCATCYRIVDEASPFVPGDHEESLRGDVHEFDPEIICADCASDYPSIVDDAGGDGAAALRALDSWLEAILPAPTK